MSSSRDTLPDVSVVIASVESARSIDRCIDSIRDAVGARHAELFVVDASRDGSAFIAERKLGKGNVLRFPPGTLVPRLWAAGIARSTGGIVALTTGHFEVAPTWISRLTAGLHSGERGVAGRMDLGDQTSVIDWAVFFLRYSEFLTEPDALVRARGIAADNAAYRGDEIRRFVAASEGSFWEVEFHRQIHAADGSLALTSGASARYGRSFPFWTIAAHRFHHGRHAGAWRASTRQRSRSAIVLASPVVPFLLAVRAWGRVKSRAGFRWRFLASLPAFLLLAVAWSAGECIGAMSGAFAARRSGLVPV